MFAVAFALENLLSRTAFGLDVHERAAPAGNSSRIGRILYAAAREIRSRVLVYVFAFDLVSVRSPRCDDLGDAMPDAGTLETNGQIVALAYAVDELVILREDGGVLGYMVDDRL